MKKQFEILKSTKENMISFLDKCTEEELTTISPNYNNNIYWNAAHLIASEQLLCYKMAGLPMNLDENFINLFKKGTVPTAGMEMNLSELKNMINSSTIQLEADYNEGLFKNYAPYMTSYGVELTSIEDAISFGNVHFAVHFGYMLAQKRGV